MAKRFTDTEKWKKVWFRKLSPVNKCFWQYLIDTCNHAGIWEVDFELASIFIGSELKEDEVKKEFKKQYVELSGGKKWLLADFVGFQYGELNPENRAHNSVISILKKEGAYKGLTRPLQGCKDKDKDMVKDKDKDKDPDFEEFYSIYPKKRGKGEAYRAWKKLSPSSSLKEKILKAVAEQTHWEDWKKEKGRFIPNPATWLNRESWEDELPLTEEQRIWNQKN